MSKRISPNPDAEQPRRPFRLRRLLAFGFAVILLVSLWPWGSYDPQDIDRLSGGIPATDIIGNGFGYLGAWLSWGVLVAFGLGAYPMALLLLAASTRRLLSGRGMRPATCPTPRTTSRRTPTATARTGSSSRPPTPCR